MDAAEAQQQAAEEQHAAKERIAFPEPEAAEPAELSRLEAERAKHRAR